ncbi:hypothetical protein SAMN06264364_10115 [Quadrisphaera granulorum]|uniref:O-antigen ligase n=1 Tax=Quadrisphaera granulorum TaxID=317664 RepID=A0A316AEL8_9ACTN|nr:hypothetical protein [Quadrisphaera granulorum]PWJ56042.1 hypothetical protein BXY45_10115 [Quadrisphaera granulorum]SZE94676.1 hypothetical protein SAMN06264364_10115 [Quadrisphaera granulorum]
MRVTVEAQRRAVSRVLDLEQAGTSRSDASRSVASQAGLPVARLERWLEDQEALARRNGGGSRRDRSPRARWSQRPGLRPVAILRSATAGITALAVGADVMLKFPITTTTVLSVLLLPVWLPRLRRYRGATTVVAFGVVALLAGWTIAELTTQHVIDPKLAQSTAVGVLSALGAVGLLLWVRSALGVETMALIVGVGMLVAVGLDGFSPINAWKYQLSLPVTTIVLAVVARWRQPVLSAAALVLLAVVGLAFDSRSYAGFCVLTAAVMLWQAFPSAVAGQARSAWHRVQMGMLLVLAITGAGAIGQQLLVGGALGEEVAARSQAQVTAGGGSLLVGGRPEMQATISLVPSQPWGFGLGAVPNQEDVLLAKQGMAKVGIQPGNGYVDHYMFGGHIELHSIIADLWASCGVVGAAFGLAMAFLLLDALLADAVSRRASAQSVFWVASAVWFLGFGPLYTNMPDVAFALAVALTPAVVAHRRRKRTTSWSPLHTTPPLNP